MYNINGKRVIEVAIKHVIKLPENTLDNDVEEYLKQTYPNEEYIWCDGDQDVFESF
jgi:hypothetical protein